MLSIHWMTCDSCILTGVTEWVSGTAITSDLTECILVKACLPVT